MGGERTWEIERAYERGRGDALGSLAVGLVGGFISGLIVGALLF